MNVKKIKIRLTEPLPDMRQIYLLLLSSFLFLASCSKNDGPGEVGPGQYPNNLNGTIYYDWATEGILKMSLPDGTGGSFIPDNTKLNNFDISRDGNLRLTVVNASTLGQYDVRFTTSNMGDGSIVDEFVYNSPGGNTFCKGYLSPDNSLIVVTSNDQEDGITILKRNGEFFGRLHDINGEQFEFNQTVLWLPNNSLLMKHKNYIIRLDPPYNSGTLVKQMDYADWGDLQVNLQGTMLVVRIGNHLHTMNMDGTNLTQLTTSNFKEAEPVFSPDGKHILIGTEYRQTGPFGYIWQLKIIPSTGGPYHVDPVEENSREVIPVIWKDKDKIESAGGQMLWR
ncbi:TolB family protein [Sphingobacterium paludis]|uniref:WD40 repeat protein n=1 Tax=Sphingobacterium paludis TaxID=1476465 RepID=A0A4R7CV37_9SPHI|nr:PD40 domain-containing protein [Sphingobacterium paludis]TDS11692.1 WD40 repeat protein [Sphingobacterium paludis]